MITSKLIDMKNKGFFKYEKNILLKIFVIKKFTLHSF